MPFFPKATQEYMGDNVYTFVYRKDNDFERATSECQHGPVLIKKILAAISEWPVLGVESRNKPGLLIISRESKSFMADRILSRYSATAQSLLISLNL